MILSHIWGIYTHPKKEWQIIADRHESFVNSLAHTLFISIIPAVCAYYSSVHIGWSIGAGERIFLSADSALAMAIIMYGGLVGGIIALGLMAHWMAHEFGAEPSHVQAIEVSAYTATPLYMVGFATLYPELWFIMCVGLLGIAYSVYMLYSGVPIVMGIDEDRGFIYASSLVTVGLCFLVSMLGFTVFAWSSGIGPSFVH
ncbi:MAG: YIP1 family protein [Psychrobium sp.]|nr:YIP1 family protein [Psychrobium sp.]